MEKKSLEKFIGYHVLFEMDDYDKSRIILPENIDPFYIIRNYAEGYVFNYSNIEFLSVRPARGYSHKLYTDKDLYRMGITITYEQVRFIRKYEMDNWIPIEDWLEEMDCK